MGCQGFISCPARSNVGGFPWRRGQTEGGSAQPPKDTAAPHAPSKRHPKGSSGGSSIPSGLPSPGLSCSHVPCRWLPKGTGPPAFPGLCGWRYHPSRPCGRMSILPLCTAQTRSPSHPSLLTAEGLRRQRQRRQKRRQGRQGAVAARLAEGRASRQLPHRPPAEPSSLPPPRLPWAFPVFPPRGLGAQLPLAGSASWYRQRPPPAVPCPRCCGGTWACGAPQRSSLHLHLPPSNPASLRLGTAASILRPAGSLLPSFLWKEPSWLRLPQQPAAVCQRERAPACPDSGKYLSEGVLADEGAERSRGTRRQPQWGADRSAAQGSRCCRAAARPEANNLSHTQASPDFLPHPPFQNTEQFLEH